MHARLRALWILVFVSGLFAACDDGKKSEDPVEDMTVESDVPEGDTVTCPEGTATCACRSDNTCDTGLVCTAGLCETDTAVASGSVVVGSADARSCDLLFAQGVSEIVSATYESDTRGALRRRNPNVAISISRPSDTPFPSPALSLGLNGAVTGVSITSATCFDATGATIADPQVSIAE